MRYRVKTILAATTIIALMLGVTTWGSGKQRQIEKLEVQVATLQARNKELQARSQWLVTQSTNRSNVGVPWDVERAMLLDGVAPSPQLTR